MMKRTGSTGIRGGDELLPELDTQEKIRKKIEEIEERGDEDDRAACARRREQKNENFIKGLSEYLAETE